MGGEPYQPIWMAELGSVDGLPGMLIARKVSSVVCSLPPSPQPTAGVLDLCNISVAEARPQNQSPGICGTLKLCRTYCILVYVGCVDEWEIL